MPHFPSTVSGPEAELDPGARALLDLSLRRGVTDEQIASMLGAPVDDIARRRKSALDALVKKMDRSGEATDLLAALGDVAPASVAVPAPLPTVCADDTPAAPHKAKGTRFDIVVRTLAAVYLAVLLGAVVAYKAAFMQMLVVDPIFGVYGLIVAAFILSRFLFSLLYRPATDAGLEPHVAIVMPGFNEEHAIARSMRSLLQVDYPAEKLQIVAVNDGSTDGTLREMRAAEAESAGRVQVIDLGTNQGKRAAMAAGIRATDAEIIAFVDSDSVLEPDALRILVQSFADPKVGAVCGHADVLNVRESWLSRMQAVRYFTAFKVVKAAESIFNAVTCCSGCFSAYRREAIMPRLDWWENQSFLGIPSTFGDDRSLTNCVLRDWKVKYESRAVSHTAVPPTFRQFMKQQLRWKRSWTRESLIASTFMWRKNPIAALTTYIGIALTLVAPVVAVRTLLWQPLMDGAGFPLVYLVGVYAMAVAYGLYYAVRQHRYDGLWVCGVAFCFFYMAFLLWQTYYAMVTVRTAAWGTRPATAGVST